jgi:hypothetical protein
VIVDKGELLGALVERLRTEHLAAERLARETADAANHPEARPENDKDTRKIELSYLAAGQAGRAAELGAAVALLGTMRWTPSVGPSAGRRKVEPARV